MVNYVSIPKGSLETLFYKKSLNLFSASSIENLFFYGGVIYINKEPISLGYTTKNSRLTSSILEDIPNYKLRLGDEGSYKANTHASKRIRISIKNTETDPELKKLFVDST